MLLPIISVSDFSHLPQQNLVILDARAGKNMHEIYLEKHIKDARFIDLDKDLATIGDDPAFGGRHPLPTLEKFSDTLSRLGIKENSHIVIYDDKNGANAAARAWWMLKSFGFDKVQVLDGGMQSAEKFGVKFSSGEEKYDKADLITRNHWKLSTATIEDIENDILSKNSTVIDVRDAYRYNGESEPIDLVAGHIPGAINIPFSENLNSEGLFLKPEELKEKYSLILKDKNQNLIVHCGSGVTACHTLLALAYAGIENTSLYVGSWSEWSRRDKEIAKN